MQYLLFSCLLTFSIILWRGGGVSVVKNVLREKFNNSFNTYLLMEQLVVNIVHHANVILYLSTSAQMFTVRK
jgi:hypothetical protein